MSATPPADTPEHGRSGLRWPGLTVGLVLMVVLTLYPPLLVNRQGQADHALATALLFAMSAGFISGVGFVPRWWGWRWLFSGWACAAALLLAVWLKSQQ